MTIRNAESEGRESVAACRRGAWVAMIGVLAVAVAARAWFLWGTPMIPGMNGGYYPVQARALIEHGCLGIPDLPLTFMIHAAVARVLQAVTGRGLEASILLAVRMCDTLLPPLAALPVFLLGLGWCARAGRGAWRAVAAAAVVALGLPAFVMAGDFQKNALGLVWLSGLVFALHGWMEHRTRRGALASIAMLGLCGLTHIGVFGAALLLTASVWGADLLLARRGQGLGRLRHLLAVGAGAAAVVAVVAGIVLWKFDPARVRRLAGAVTSPVSFLENGGHEGGPGGGRPPVGPGGGRGGGPGVPPGAPGVLRLPGGAVTALLFVLAAGAAVLPFRGRRDVPQAARAAAIGCAACLVILTGPWVGGDVGPRLRLIAGIPAAFAGLHVLIHLPGRWTASVVAAAVLGLLGHQSASMIRHGGRPILREDAYAELQTLAAKVANPGRTLIVARHGLEWWTAWTLHTHVAQDRALSADDWTKYASVLFLQEKGRGRGGPFAPGLRPDREPGVRMPPGFRDGPPPGMGPGFGPGGFPPPFSDGMGPPDDGSPGRGGRRPGFPGGGPMMGAVIPDDAEILHDGTHFRLARVASPPARFTVRQGPR